MFTLDSLLLALTALFTPFNLFLLVVGVTFGIVIGILPGLGAPLAVTLILPFTFNLEPIQAFSLLLGAYNAAVYGGSITAITLGIPGSGAAAATLLDGYAMSRNHKGGKALGLSLASSVVGGLFSAICLFLIAPLLAQFALRFGPREYLAVGIFGIVIVGKVSGDDIWKGMIMACSGLFLTFIGLDQVNGTERFLFGSINLYDGLPLIPLLLGVYAFSEILIITEKSNGGSQYFPQFKLAMPRLRELKERWLLLLKSSSMGTLIGLIPGQGATIAAFMAYGEAKRKSATPENFGKGAEEGVIAPEAANNATIGGALIPTLTLGIPGSVVTAILMGALAMHGFAPGPKLFLEAPDLVYAIFIGLFTVNLLLLPIGSGAIMITAKLLKTPMTIITPLVLTLCFIGAYASQNSIFGVIVMLFSGMTGYILRKLEYPIVPLVLGFVIGPMIETSFRQSLVYTDGNVITFIQSPIANVIYIVLILSLLGEKLKAPHSKLRSIFFDRKAK